MIKIFFNLFLITSLFNFCESITRITYSNSNCDTINAVEIFQLSECRLMSLGGQLFSVKINICNTTNWQTFVYFNSLNCSEPKDLISNGPSNICFLSDSILYEKIVCRDIIVDQINFSSVYYLHYLYMIPIILLFIN